MEDIRRSFRLIFNPSKESAGRMSILKSLKFYYAASIIPFVLVVILGLLGLRFGIFANSPSFIPMSSLIASNSLFGFALLALAIIYMWILLPVGFFINAALYQLVGKHFLRLFRENYDKTFAALVFGSMPFILLFWTFFIPIINAIAFVVLPVWALVVTVISLSTQQRITRLQAIAAMAVLAALAILVIMMAFSAIGISAGLNALMQRMWPVGIR